MEFFIYLGCLGFGLLFTILSAVLGHVFGGHDVHTGDVGTHGHAGVGADHSGMPGVSIFSPVVVCSFVTAFGAFGLVFSQIERMKSVWISAPLASVGGIVVAAATFFVFNAIFSRTQASSEAQVGTLVGTTATVITPIPANGVGEIAYINGGSRYTAPAREQTGVPIANGQSVKICRITGSQFFVSAF